MNKSDILNSLETFHPLLNKLAEEIGLKTIHRLTSRLISIWKLDGIKSDRISIVLDITLQFGNFENKFDALQLLNAHLVTNFGAEMLPIEGISARIFSPFSIPSQPTKSTQSIVQYFSYFVQALNFLKSVGESNIIRLKEIFLVPGVLQNLVITLKSYPNLNDPLNQTSKFGTRGRMSNEKRRDSNFSKNIGAIPDSLRSLRNMNSGILSGLTTDDVRLENQSQVQGLLKDYLELIFEVLSKIGYFVEELGKDGEIATLFKLIIQLIERGIFTANDDSTCVAQRNILHLLSKFNPL